MIIQDHENFVLHTSFGPILSRDEKLLTVLEDKIHLFQSDRPHSIKIFRWRFRDRFAIGDHHQKWTWDQYVNEITVTAPTGIQVFGTLTVSCQFDADHLCEILNKNGGSNV